MYQKKVEVKKTLGQTTEDRLMIDPEIVDYCIGKICCGGSWMVKGDMVEAGEFDKIQKLTEEARALAE